MILFPPHILAEAEAVIRAAQKKKLRLATAESCTGGLISGSLTEISGSSDVFDEGFITYSYDAKVSQLHVQRQLLLDNGAVSSQVALQMVEGALKNSAAAIAVSATGIAGPGGGTPEKPVGLVYIAIGVRGEEPQVTKNLFKGTRNEVRSQTVLKALSLFKQEIDKH